MIHFVRSVSLRNRFLVGWNSSTAYQKTSISWFIKLTLRTKWITPCERASKTVPENSVGNCVHFCLRPLQPLERCAQYISPQRLPKYFISLILQKCHSVGPGCNFAIRDHLLSLQLALPKSLVNLIKKAMVATRKTQPRARTNYTILAPWYLCGQWC